MLVLFVSCGASDSARSENRNKEYEEYMRILGWAMVSNDISEINYAIKYVNDIIERDGEKYIHSIYNTNPGLNAAMMYEWANIYDSSKEDILRSMWPAMIIGAQNVHI